MLTKNKDKHKPTYEELEKRIKELERVETNRRDENGKPTRFLGTQQDITNQKNAEEALLSEKLLAEEYINSIPGLFYVFDKKKRFVRWNNKWSAVTNYSDEELTVMYGTDFFEGEDKKLIGERMLQVFKEGTADAEAKLVTKDNKRISYYFTGQRKILDGNEYLIGLGIDITEKKKAEDTLIALKNNLEKEVQIRTIELEKTNIKLKNDISNRKKLEYEKELLLEQYREREKKTNCLYGISKLVEKPGIRLEDIFQGIVNLLPPSWQYPDITCAKLNINGREYQTNKCKYQESEWKQTADIRVYEKTTGTLTVRYIEKRPEFENDPFLEEEYDLLAAVAERLGKIVERFKAEKNLIKTREKLREFMESSIEGFILCDPDFKLIMVNKAAAKMMNHKSKDIIGKSILEFSPGLKESRRYAEYKKVLITGNPYSIEDTVSLPGIGRKYYKIDAFKVENNIGFSFSDITKRKNAENKLTESEEKYRVLIDSMAEGLGTVDETGTVLFANKHFCSLLGYSIDEVIGQNWISLFPEETHNVIFEQLKQRKKGKRGVYEITFKSDDDSKKTIQISANPIIDSNGNPRGSQAIFTDISEIRKIEDELKEKTIMNEILLDNFPHPAMLINRDKVVLAANKIALDFGTIIVDASSLSGFFNVIISDNPIITVNGLFIS